MKLLNKGKDNDLAKAKTIRLIWDREKRALVFEIDLENENKEAKT